jgi:hypothetical protein
MFEILHCVKLFFQNSTFTFRFGLTKFSFSKSLQNMSVYFFKLGSIIVGEDEGFTGRISTNWNISLGAKLLVGEEPHSEVRLLCSRVRCGQGRGARRPNENGRRESRLLLLLCRIVVDIDDVVSTSPRELLLRWLLLEEECPVAPGSGVGKGRDDSPRGRRQEESLSPTKKQTLQLSNFKVEFRNIVIVERGLRVVSKILGVT